MRVNLKKYTRFWCAATHQVPYINNCVAARFWKIRFKEVFNLDVEVTGHDIIGVVEMSEETFMWFTLKWS